MQQERADRIAHLPAHRLQLDAVVSQNVFLSCSEINISLKLSAAGGLKRVKRVGIGFPLINCQQAAVNAAHAR